jgi:uncharacterized protein with HEPN domain
MLPVEDEVRVRHMLEAAGKACGYAAKSSRQDLPQHEVLLLALVRLIEVVGEAANKVSPETRERTSSIPWRQIIDMRNHVVHAYMDVDVDVVWDTIVDDLPPLIHQLQAILPPGEPARR